MSSRTSASLRTTGYAMQEAVHIVQRLETHSQSQTAWISISSLSLTRCVTLNILHNFSVLQFPHQWGGSSICRHLTHWITMKVKWVRTYKLPELCSIQIKRLLFLSLQPKDKCELGSPRGNINKYKKSKLKEWSQSQIISLW